MRFLPAFVALLSLLPLTARAEAQQPNHLDIVVYGDTPGWSQTLRAKPAAQ